MLRKSCGFGVTQSLRSGSQLHITIRQNGRRLYRNTLFANNVKTISRSDPRHLSSMAGSSLLRFHDPHLRWSIHQSGLIPSAQDDDSHSSSSQIWIATSPSSLKTSQSSILDRIISWLRQCWQKISRLSFLVVRTGEVVIYLSPLIILTPAALLSHHMIQSSMLSNVAWTYTIKAIQGLGPVAVKFCQWAATRRDIFSPALCDRLSVLHDSGYPHSPQWTHRVLTEAFGDYEGKGLKIDEVVGCGAAAQVYKGRIAVETDSTQCEKQVAIKVQHPRFQEMVDRDLDFIEIIAGSLHSLPIEHLKMLNLPRAVEEFSVLLRDQIDLSAEADNLRQFRKNFYNNEQSKKEVSTIIFPQPIDGWTSEHVIVEEYVGDAVPISDFLHDSSREGMDMRKELAAPLLRAFFKMVFIDNFIHGDLHPGNVLVKKTLVPKEESSWSILSAFEDFFKGREKKEAETETDYKTKRSIVFLDAGIVVSLSPNDKKNLFDLFRAVVFNDGNRAGRLMVERAKYERCSQSPESLKEFSEGIEGIVAEFHNHRKEGLTLGAVRIGSLLGRVLDLCRIHGVEIDPAMANVVISTLVLEGLGRSLSPDLDLLTFARPFLMLRSDV